MVALLTGRDRDLSFGFLRCPQTLAVVASGIKTAYPLLAGRKHFISAFEPTRAGFWLFCRLHPMYPIDSCDGGRRFPRPSRFRRAIEQLFECWRQAGLAFFHAWLYLQGDAFSRSHSRLFHQGRRNLEPMAELSVRLQRALESEAVDRNLGAGSSPAGELVAYRFRYEHESPAFIFTEVDGPAYFDFDSCIHFKPHRVS